MKATLILLSLLSLAFLCNTQSVTHFQSFNYENYRIKHENFRARISELSAEGDLQNGLFNIVPGLADPSKISFESINFPGYYLRHRNYEIWLDKFDGSDLNKKDATFKIVPGLANSSWISFESHNYPGHYIRHSGYVLWIHKSDESQLFKMDATFRKTPTFDNAITTVFLQPINFLDYRVRNQCGRAKISQLSTDMDSQDGSWMMVPGLADPTLVSFKSITYKDHYLRHKNFEIWLDKFNGTDDSFKKHATFKIVPGLADPSWISFESVNYPGYYINHAFYMLGISKPDGSDGFKQNASFKRLFSMK